MVARVTDTQIFTKQTKSTGLEHRALVVQTIHKELLLILTSIMESFRNVCWNYLRIHRTSNCGLVSENEYGIGELVRKHYKTDE